MEAPFVFGKKAFGERFTDRDSETFQLVTNFTSLINTILISPRRWGKSSLVAKAADEARIANVSLRFVFIDLYNVRNEEQFYQLLAKQVLQASSSKIEEIAGSIKNFMVKIIPRLSYSPGSLEDFSLSMDWQEVKKNPDEILNLAENIAVDKKIKFVICIDEFQNIGDFDDPLSLQRKMRSQWQNHQNVAYCLYGSKRHMLMEVFTSSSMPFYKFGDILFLQKIAKEDWIPFIQKRFLSTGKDINAELAGHIATLADCHPYYVQQLAQQCWLRTEKACTPEIVIDAHENLMMQLSLLFQTITDGLSNTQINFINALINGSVQFSSQKVIQEYKLGSSANVSRIKQALVEKEVIDILGNEITFMDPIYFSWLKKYYYKIPDNL